MNPTPATRIAAPVALALALGLGACAATPSKPQTPAQAIEDRHTQADRLVAKAIEYTANNQLEDAINLYKQAVQLFPQHFGAWYNLGVLCNRTGKYAGAVEAWRVAADVAPTDPRPYASLGLQYQELGFLTDASQCYARALERDPNHLPALKKAIEIDQLTDNYSDLTLERIRLALLQENDPKWVEYLRRMLVKTQERVSRAGGNTGH
jgi:tetratricopeptide (TPR) repeat protein